MVIRARADAARPQAPKPPMSASGAQAAPLAAAADAACRSRVPAAGHVAADPPRPRPPLGVPARQRAAPGRRIAAGAPHAHVAGDGTARLAPSRSSPARNAGKELDLTKPLTTLGKPGVQVAVITKRPQGYFITHVEGANFPVLNGKTARCAGASAQRSRHRSSWPA